MALEAARHKLSRLSLGDQPGIFGVLGIPLGIYLGFVATALPFLLHRAGVPVEQIARIGSLLALPAVLFFLWSPVVDVKLRRRTWFALAATVSAVLIWAAFPMVGTRHLNIMTVLAMASGMAALLTQAASGGLIITTLARQEQSKASAWYEAGRLGGSAIGATALLWLSEHTSLTVVGMIAAAFIVIPTASAFAIPEPPRTPSPWFRGRFPKMGREILSVVREHKWSAVLLVLPVGTGAASMLLPAVALTYGVGSSGVMWVNGLGGGIVLALGSLCSALLPGDWDRRLTFVGAGFSNALAAMILVSGRRPGIYIAGTFLYMLTTGFCWARYTALLVDIVGSEGNNVSSIYSAFLAFGNIPLAYMIWFDGMGYSKLGVHGLVWTDAFGNLLVFAVVAVLWASKLTPPQRI